MDGFFGQSEEYSFRYFSLAHFLPIIIAIALLTLIYLFRKRIAAFKREKSIRFVFAFFMIVAEMSYFWRLIYTGSNIEDHLPITICGWACIFGAFMLMSENKVLFAITYFWAFGGTLSALITPVVIMRAGPMYYRYYQFWFEHLAIFISVFYMIWVKGYRPNLASLAQAMGALSVIGAFALYVNHAIGGKANYLFLANVKEEGGSVLDFLPQSIPLKVLIMASLAFAIFFLAYLPWLIMAKRRARLEAVAQAAAAT